MPDELPDREQWNVQLALDYVDGSVSDLRDLADIWARQYPKLLSEIRDALLQQHADHLRIAAHTLKGSLQILCAAKAGFLAAELELCGREGNLENGMNLLSRLESEVATVSRELQAFLSTH